MGGPGQRPLREAAGPLVNVEVEWHGDHPWARCQRCTKLVRLDKALIGSLHACVTDCQLAGRHLAEATRRRGPFWRRRTERYCERCGAVEESG